MTLTVWLPLALDKDSEMAVMKCYANDPFMSERRGMEN